MKQVVGAPFTGVLSQRVETEKEKEIVDLLVAASKQPFDNPGLPIMEQQKILNSAMSSVLEKLRAFLGSRVKIYLQSIAHRLLDPRNTLSWSATSNNCQNFCNSLIDTDLFEPLVNGPHVQSSKIPSPLYLMSFVCPPEGYLHNKIISKFDVPSGLTEEYLLRFHFGRHDEADIIDTLQEYWYDWGAFGSPLYNYQNLFPWDCTEAYMRYPTSPWTRDRLTILTASSMLTRAAAAMAKSPSFCKATAWLHSKDKGLRRIDPSLARVKLGGIHRAQPFSHYFEAGTYSHYFLAEWALKKREEQERAYETLRDGRAKLPDLRGWRVSRFSEATREPSQFDRQFDGFWGLNVGDPGYIGCEDQKNLETEAQFDAQMTGTIATTIIVDSQLGSIQDAAHSVAEAA
ncbi:hypothetical protein BBP40_000745, partial [Aspergillus hancockii]